MEKTFRTIWIFLFLFTLAEANQLKIGQKAPSFKLNMLEGDKAISLADYKGKVVLVDFWASWCAPCKISLPLLDELGKKFYDLKIITVNIDDDKSNAFGFLKDLKLDLTVVYDSSKKVVESYNLPEMPTAYLIDQYGIIRYIHSGYKTENMRKLEFKIRGLLDRR